MIRVQQSFSFLKSMVLKLKTLVLRGQYKFNVFYDLVSLKEGFNVVVNVFLRLVYMFALIFSEGGMV